MYEVHPRGITLEQSATCNRIVVNGSQSDYVKLQIDLHGAVMCEVQYMEQNNSDKWRIPSFRGVYE